MLVIVPYRNLLKLNLRTFTTALPKYQQAEQQVENKLDESVTPTTKEEPTTSTSKKKNRALFFYHGRRNTKSKVKTINHISSFVATSQELSCVTMTRDFQVTSVLTTSLQRKWSGNNFSQYFSTIHPFIQEIPQVDAHIIERPYLPPTYYAINLHLRSVAMLLIGMLEKPEESCIFSGSRQSVAKYAKLGVGGTASRMCSLKLVHSIVQEGMWEGRPVEISPEFLKTSSEATFYGGENGNHISPETADALIQALCFWKHFENK
nr:uncharacterized protein LOC100177363 [Ciona intestinalis]|eukprot:XP_002129123.3 uncharacterized protein LOC100177363 [Ciona intestinalis]